MIRYLLTSFLSGVLFGIMDAIIHGNPLASKLYSIYAPIQRSSINIAAGILIDLVYGFIIAGAFLILMKSLPGKSRFLKGLSFSLMIWLFRVVMAAAAQWMMLTIPNGLVLYTIGTGLVEMTVLGLFCSALLYRIKQVSVFDKWTIQR